MNLVALLTESSVPLTLEDIANRMVGQYGAEGEARRTAFERDKRALRSMGVPITTQTLSGNDAGKTAYSIDRSEYNLIDFGLTKDELTALDAEVANEELTVYEEDIDCEVKLMLPPNEATALPVLGVLKYITALAVSTTLIL